MKNHTNTHLHPRQYGLRTPRSAFRAWRAFTLVELLVVISIIAILAALLLPVISRVKIKAQVQKAHMETGSIANAIHTYEADYSKFPVSAAAMSAATAVPANQGGPEDFTYGTAGVACVGPGGSNPQDIPVGNGGFSTPTPGTYASILTPTVATHGNYQTNNSEVMAVLLDMTNWPASGPTINNPDHAKNPQRTQYLNATMAIDCKAPGIGQDGTYRDPWGNPYIITVDLNYDDKARDAFYRDPNVSQDPAPPNLGLNGLIKTTLPSGGGTVFEANSPVMVWSAGPDKMIDPKGPANKGANKDNVISWQ